jgi:hypothetical protein
MSSKGIALNSANDIIVVLFSQEGEENVKGVV